MTNYVTSQRFVLHPVRTIGIYIVASLAWIFLSDTLMATQFHDTQSYRNVAIFKGSLFIFFTATILFFLARRHRRDVKLTRDIFSEQIKAAEEIQQLAYYDTETALPNQNLLMDRLNQVIVLDSRESRNTAVIYVGLTGFPSIVDALGHGGSGLVARILAERFAAVLRQSDTLARINRDEFAIVLGGAVMEADITMVLNKLQTMLNEPVKMEHGELLIAAAIGVACYPPDGLTADILLQNAHIAMNQARDQGPNSFKFFSSALNSKALERHRIETHMLRGLEEGEFHLCYQPKFAMNGRDITGMEALLRWIRPGRHDPS